RAGTNTVKFPCVIRAGIMRVKGGNACVLTNGLIRPKVYHRTIVGRHKSPFCSTPQRIPHGNGVQSRLADGDRARVFPCRPLIGEVGSLGRVSVELERTVT